MTIKPEDFIDPRFDLKAYIDEQLRSELQRRVNLKAEEDERRMIYGDPDAPKVGGILNPRPLPR